MRQTAGCECQSLQTGGGMGLTGHSLKRRLDELMGFVCDRLTSLPVGYLLIGWFLCPPDQGETADPSKGF